MRPPAWRSVGRDPDFLHFEIDLARPAPVPETAGARLPYARPHDLDVPGGSPHRARRSRRSTSAIARMQQIDDALPAADGLACFNRMYLDVTQQVQARITQGFFADPAFLTQLDVVFANLYFAAVNAAGRRQPDRPAGGLGARCSSRAATPASSPSSSPWPA